MTSVIVVDEEDFYRTKLVRELLNRGYETYESSTHKDAIDIIKKKKPDMALVDLKLPDKNGLEVVRDAKIIYPKLKIIILTGYGSIATAIQAIKLGAVSYISKPAEVSEILAAFHNDTDMYISLTPEPITTPSLARVEWEHINRVLLDCSGNISKAAKRLGIHRRSLQRKLIKYPPKH